MNREVLHAISSVDELRDQAELLDIVYYEVSGRRAEGFATPPPVPDDDGENPSDHADIQLMQRLEGGALSIRMRATVITSEGRFVADVAAIFRIAERVSVPADVVMKFADVVATPVIRPYLREAVHQSALRLGLDAPLLTVLDTREKSFWRSTSSEKSTDRP
ncbi:hypothetical protein [Streptomyces niveus]